MGGLGRAHSCSVACTALGSGRYRKVGTCERKLVVVKAAALCSETGKDIGCVIIVIVSVGILMMIIIMCNRNASK